MKSILIASLFLATPLLVSTEAYAAISPHSVNHPEFHARHPEAMPREGMTGKRVGDCNAYQSCSIK